MTVHPHALVSPRAEIGNRVHVGPFATIEAGAIIGPGCRIEARATIKSGVRLGSGNQIAEGAVLGGAPQHLSPPAETGGLVIGDRNVIRENVTLHRAMHAGSDTQVGDDCLLMVGSHVAHDCVIRDSVVLTNNVMLAGHVEIGERAYLGGGAAVHQFCRIGRIAMVGGMARVVQDIPPFVTIDGGTGHVVGLNRVGLRRAGLLVDEVKQLKAAYHVMYRSGLSFEDRLAELAERFPSGAASELEQFLRGGSRGFVRERRTPPGATIRMLPNAEPTSTPAVVRKAG
ncbi:MAG: acyl-ACP--UDP-N-acetylglucosamine O-acyltransferase [Planctomycetota bacterium]